VLRQPNTRVLDAVRRRLGPRLVCCMSLLVGLREDDSVVYRRWLLERNVKPEGVTEARDEGLYLVRFGDRRIAVGERHEPFGEFTGRPRSAQHG
jgi:hypothetical protein